MQLTEEQKRERQVNMFGMSVEELLEEPLFPLRTNSEKLMYAMSILSDCQEYPIPENVRQFINKAKFWISEVRRNPYDE